MDEPADRIEAPAPEPGSAVRQVAHDLNNSLTLIIGYSQLLNRGLADPQLRALVDLIEGAARQAGNLAATLLDLSRPADPTRVTDLGAETAQLQPVLDRLTGPHVSVGVARPDQPVPVGMAPSETDEIVIGLVVAAAEAAGAGGTVMVRVDQEVGGGGGAVLSVAVEGVGADPGRWGSGLSDVLGLVSSRGGRLLVEPAPGGGSTVAVWLPGHDDGQSEDEPANSPTWPVDRTLDGRILFVEDEPELRRLGQESLATIGLDVVAAESAEKALTTLEQDGPFDALVTDIVLPGRSGVQLVDAAREAHPNLRVLYATGYSGPPDPTRTPAPGERVLRKPYRPDDLRFEVAELLQEAAP